MEMNVKFESIEEILEFAKLFGANTINNCRAICKEVCTEECGDTCKKVCDTECCGDTESKDTDKEEPVTEEKPKPKRKPRKKKVEEPKVEEPKDVVETPDDNLPPTFKGVVIVDKQPEVATEKVDIETAEAPKLFNTVMSVNETVRALMMSGTIKQEAIMKVGAKLAQLNSALFNKFNNATINDKASVEADIAEIVNGDEVLTLLG